MPDSGDSFLPRIHSVFYAVFDGRLGPKIVYQVPEGLIGCSSGQLVASVPPTPSIELSSPAIASPATPVTPSTNDVPSRNSSTSLASPSDYRSRNVSSTVIRSASTQPTLFNFDDISKYVIPASELCGRLVTCSTKNHRIIGFPVSLKNSKLYDRNYFRYNLCFVFERGADLSCYEPVVRKVGRVLTSCEEESRFLSNPQKSTALHAILEQLYEDLNSYAETSIPIDQFNSIELKIFPFYPNPPAVKDYMVPLALINLSKRVEDNWDLTMAKVCKYIDGVNHISRIAHLAICDIDLTRQAISHLLFYQVIMTIDIFQYSNMYIMRKSIQWLAEEPHVKDECGPYVTKPGKSIPDWPTLLYLYTRLRPGKTLYEWGEEYQVEKLGIDIRRFTSFGVIKGFLRRVHRWPFYIAPEPKKTALSPTATFTVPGPIPNTRQRGYSHTSMRFPTESHDLTGGGPHTGNPHYYRSRPLSTVGSTVFSSPEYQMATSTTLNTTNPNTSSNLNPNADSTNTSLPTPPPPTSANQQQPLTATQRARRASAAEKILEQLRNRELQKSAAAVAAQHGSGFASPRHSWIHFQRHDGNSNLNPAYNSGNEQATTPPHTDRNGGADSATPTLGNLPTPTLTAKPLQASGTQVGVSATGGSGVGGTGSALGLFTHTHSTQGRHTSQERGGVLSNLLLPPAALSTVNVNANTQGSAQRTSEKERGEKERRKSLISPSVPPPSPVLPKNTNLMNLGMNTTTTTNRGRISKSPSTNQLVQPGPSGGHGRHSISGGSTTTIGPGQGTTGGVGISGSGSIIGSGSGGGGGGGLAMGSGSISGNSVGAGGGGGSASAGQLSSSLVFPPQLIPLLDGEHHTDELCVRFEVGWPLLERWLELIGGAEVGSDKSRVIIIYR